VPICLLEIIDRLEVSVQVVPRVIPRVAWIVYVLVGPGVREDNLACISSEVCKGVEKMA